MTAAIGHNQPPEPLDPFAAMAAHIEDLVELAESALSGAAISTQEQADQIKELKGDIKTAAKDADTARDTEKRPHLEAGRTIDAKWKPLIERAKMAAKVAAESETPWLVAQQAEKDAEQARLRAEAERLADEARAKFTHTAPTDLAARYEAEELAKIAKKATVAANKIDRSATGLRTSYRAEILDPIAFGKWAWEHRRPDYMKFLETLAASEARANVNIDGLTIHTLRNAA